MSSTAPGYPLGLDPLIAEAKQRARRRRLIAVLVGLSIAAAATVAVVAVHRSAPVSVSPLSGPAAQLYEVTTTVAYRGGTAHPETCESSMLMTNEPGGGCSGVSITGYDFGGIPRDARYPDGGWYTRRPLRLIGTWDGHLFHVTSATRVAGWAETHPAEPDCGAHRTGPIVRVSGAALTEAASHVDIFEVGPCGHTSQFLVAAADHRTVSYLKHRFGKSVLVAGYLQPTGRK